MSFKVAPGVRIRASSRGLSAGVGPRAARVHVGNRGVGISSGIGPVTGYTRLGGDQRRSSRGSTKRATSGPTKASVAAYERELKTAQKEADIDKVAELEKALVSVHQQSFPKARRIELPAIDPVDAGPIKTSLEADAGIPALEAAVGGGEAPPQAPEPEPVDRYELMRDHRRRARQGIPFWRIREQVEGARKADHEAEMAADDEAARRADAQQAEQVRLDALWAELGQARSSIADQIALKVAEEKQRREAERVTEQAELDADWTKLQANDPEVTLVALEAAFADNESPAAAIDCDGERTTVVMQMASPRAIVPERKPAHTPTGKRTLKKRTKTEINTLYLEALGSNVLATVREALAVAPGTEVVQMLVVRRETDKKHAGELAAIYIGEFARTSCEGASGSRLPGKVLSLADEAVLNLKGKTDQVAPIELDGRAGLEAVLKQVASGLAAPGNT